MLRIHRSHTTTTTTGHDQSTDIMEWGPVYITSSPPPSSTYTYTILLLKLNNIGSGFWGTFRVTDSSSSPQSVEILRQDRGGRGFRGGFRPPSWPTRPPYKLKRKGTGRKGPLACSHVCVYTKNHLGQIPRLRAEPFLR